MGEVRYGRQTPTASHILPYKDTKGPEAIQYYNESSRTAIEWQELLTYDLMAVDDEGLWIHQKFGYAVPRRNGKNEVVVIREIWGLENNEKICHTAHRTTTSHAAWERLVKVLTERGYVELGRKKKDEEDPENGFRLSKQYGLESITLVKGGTIVFRTRTPNGGLGEGFDLLVIDEAQEYTTTQESALIYTVSDSANPQTIFCGTPPTATSSGTVFETMRKDCLTGNKYDSGWAEWSLPEMVDDVSNVDLWYETNPSMGYHLDERKIRSEISSDLIDFNIQRLGVWIVYNQKSAISEGEWDALEVKKLPALKGKLYAGVKYAKDNTNVSLSIAVKTSGGKIFVETIDCRPIRNGNSWIANFLKKADIDRVIVDGANGQELLQEELKNEKIKVKTVFPTVKEIIVANAAFEQGICNENIRHMDQPSVKQIISNCDKRTISNNGGFGYKSIMDGVDVSIMDSIILAYWACSEGKERRKQKVHY